MKNGLILAVILLTACHPKFYTISERQINYLAIDSTQNSDAEMSQFISPFKNKLDSEMNRVLAYTPVALEKDFNGTLQNLSSDLVLEETNKIYQEKFNEKIDVALLNSGGLRRPFDAGNLTVGNIYELMPFDNMAVVATLDGKTFMEMIDYLKNDVRAHAISGFSFSKSGSDLDLKINGENFNLNQSYKVVTSDFLLTGGDDMKFFSKAQKVDKLNIMIREIMLTYFERIDTVNVNSNLRYLP